MISWKFHTDCSKTVGTVTSQTFWEVGSLDLTWWPDLRWSGDKIFRKGAERMADKVITKKNLRGSQMAPPRRGLGCFLNWAPFKSRILIGIPLNRLGPCAGGAGSHIHVHHCIIHASRSTWDKGNLMKAHISARIRAHDATQVSRPRLHLRLNGRLDGGLCFPLGSAQMKRKMEPSNLAPVHGHNCSGSFPRS